jgi:hypothetical protein
MWSAFQVIQKASNGLIAITQLGQLQGWWLFTNAFHRTCA